MTTRRTFLATLTAAITAFFAPTVVPARTLPRIIPRPDPDVLHHLGMTFVHDRKAERIIISGPVRSIFSVTKDEDGPAALTNGGLIVRLDDIRGIGAPWHGSVALYHRDRMQPDFDARLPLFEEWFRGDTKTFNWLAKRAAEANGEQYVPYP